MQLPNGLQAYIPSYKLHAYLLSETHAVQQFPNLQKKTDAIGSSAPVGGLLADRS